MVMYGTVLIITYLLIHSAVKVNPADSVFSEQPSAAGADNDEESSTVSYDPDVDTEGARPLVPEPAIDSTGFSIDEVILSIEPRPDVTRNTTVTVRCRATVDNLWDEPLSRTYTIYKGDNIVHTETTNSSDDVLYRLNNTGFNDTGVYECKVTIKGKEETSTPKRLTVTGLSRPRLNITDTEISEGEEVAARCTAPGETGSISFTFYDGSEEKKRVTVNTSHVEVNYRLKDAGIHDLHCSYIILPYENIPSENSNSVEVTVKETPMKPVLEILPQNIYEGDRIDLSCNITNLTQTTAELRVTLKKGNKSLSRGNTSANHNMTVQAEDSGNYTCVLKIGHVERNVSKVVSVRELFSVPTLTMSPADVFPMNPMTLTCRSESIASERLQREELTYSLDSPGSSLDPRVDGVFSVTARSDEFTYTCTAQARGFEKKSQPLMVRPRVSVSTPTISVVDKAVLGWPVQILCESDRGSLPITYTLLKNDKPESSVVVTRPGQQAVFTVTTKEAKEMRKYMCKARNGRDGMVSTRLDATVIEFLLDPLLEVFSPLPPAEGAYMVLSCSVQGTPPITFKVYRDDQEEPLFTTTSNDNTAMFEIQDLTKEHSGLYYFEAINSANYMVTSDRVRVKVGLALWKTTVIGFCQVVVVAAAAVMITMFFSMDTDHRNP